MLVEVESLIGYFSLGLIELSYSIMIPPPKHTLLS